MRFVLKNSGNSPAQRVFVNTKVIMRLGGPEASAVRSQLCEQASQMKGGISLFPNRTIPLDIDLGIPREDINAAIAKYPTFKGAFVAPSIVACVGYRPTFDQTLFYTTSYIVSISRFDIVAGGPLATFLPDEALSPDKIVLRYDLSDPVEAR